MVVTKCNFALMNCTEKKPLQAPVVARNLIFSLIFLLLPKIDLEPILLSSKSVSVSYA